MDDNCLDIVCLHCPLPLSLAERGHIVGLVSQQVFAGRVFQPWLSPRYGDTFSDFFFGGEGG